MLHKLLEQSWTLMNTLDHSWVHEPLLALKSSWEYVAMSDLKSSRVSTRAQESSAQPWTIMNTNKGWWEVLSSIMMIMHTYEHGPLAQWAIVDTHEHLRGPMAPWQLELLLGENKCSRVLMKDLECSKLLISAHDCSSAWCNKIT